MKNGDFYLNPFKIGDYVRGKAHGSIMRIDKIIDYHTVGGVLIISKTSLLSNGMRYDNMCVANIEKINNPKTSIFK